MNNFVSMLIAVLSHLELITKEDAKKLAAELHSMTIPDSYDRVHELVEEVFIVPGFTTVIPKSID